MYDAYQHRIGECDQELEIHLKGLRDRIPTQPTHASPAGALAQKPTIAVGKKRKQAQGNRPAFDLQQELHRVTGVDLTRIDGINVLVAQTVVTEVGFDMTRWKTEAHFASWLGLCPDNRISGDRVLSRGTKRVVSRAATALRMAATTLIKSQTYLGAQYRRLRTKLGAPKAITAMAHRLARLIYRMLKYGQEYVDKGSHYYEQRYRQQQINFLQKRAAKFGLSIVTPPSPEHSRG